MAKKQVNPAEFIVSLNMNGLNGRMLRCEAIIFDESDKPQTGTLSGEFKNPQAAAEALLNSIYEKGK